MLREIHAAVVGTNSNKSVRGNDVQELPTVEKEELDKLLEGLKEARSLETLSMLGFSYDIGPGVLKCDLCCSNEEYNPDVTGQLGFFQYGAESGTSFKADDVIPRQFRTLKGHLRNHVTRRNHIEKLQSSIKCKEKKQTQRQSRNREVGLRVARTAYQIFWNGDSLRCFEDILLLQQRNGTDVGDLNHSKTFASNFCPHVALAIKEKMTEYLTTVQVCLSHYGLLPAYWEDIDGSVQDRTNSTADALELPQSVLH